MNPPSAVANNIKDYHETCAHAARPRKETYALWMVKTRSHREVMKRTGGRREETQPEAINASFIFEQTKDAGYKTTNERATEEPGRLANTRLPQFHLNWKPLHTLGYDTPPVSVALSLLTPVAANLAPSM